VKPKKIVPIVEGDGEVLAVPALLHRLLQEMGESSFQVATPKNAHGSGNLAKPDGIERFVKYAWLEPDCSSVLVLIDGDSADCPMKLASGLSSRIRALNGPKPVAIVVANREYEAWFLASLASLRGRAIGEGLRFPSNCHIPGSPETIRGAKEWISKQLPRGKIYKETEHQVTMTRLIDLNEASKNSRSFRRLQSALDFLLASARTGAKGASP
jgi:Domain of unknown function (DUF4276)